MNTRKKLSGLYLGKRRLTVQEAEKAMQETFGVKTLGELIKTSEGLAKLQEAIQRGMDADSTRRRYRAKAAWRRRKGLPPLQ